MTAGKDATDGMDALDVVSRMAEAIARITLARGLCSDTDLHRAGFFPEEIERHGALARALAALRLVRFVV